MSEYTEHLLTAAPGRRRVFRLRSLVLVLVPVLAVLFRVYTARFFPSVSYLEFPLLVTLYFALMWRSPILGVFIGAAIGLIQDSLSHQPLGLYGIVKTLVGYFAASVSLRFDVDNPLLRMLLGWFFYLFHEFFYWVMVRALLGQLVPFQWQEALVFGVLNAFVALPLFHLLDKLKE